MTVFESIIARYKNELPAVYAIYQRIGAGSGLAGFDFGAFAAGGTGISAPTGQQTIGTNIATGNWQSALATLIDAVPVYLTAKEQGKAQQDQARLIALQELQRAQLQLQQEAQNAQTQLQLAQIAQQSQQITGAANAIAPGTQSAMAYILIGGALLAAFAYKRGK